FQASFALQNMPEAALELESLKLEGAGAELLTAKFDLTLYLFEDAGSLRGTLEYATDLFDAPTIDRLSGHLERVLEQVAADPGRRIRELDLLSEAERHRLLVEWNETAAEYPQDRCVHELFEEQAARTPEAVAVVYEGAALNYRQLNARANRLAHHLRGLGVGPDVIVGLCVERSLEMVVGLLGILKAGGAYLPLDPQYPAERLAFMLKDAAAPVLVTQSGLTSILPDYPGITVRLDSDWDQIAGRDGGPLERPGAPADPVAPTNLVAPNHLAYVIYTSGSTGLPKGVMVEHRNVVRLLSSTSDHFRFNESDVWTLFHSFAFDFSVWEIWGALTHGGRLIVVPQLMTRLPADFYQLVCEAGVTVLNQTPAAFLSLMSAQREASTNHTLRVVIFGGEALEVAALKPWIEAPSNQQTRLVNGYGPTETTVFATFRPLERADAQQAGVSPIGRPLRDSRIYLLDGGLEPVPQGVVGELYIGGAGVARGYLNRPELTAERFIASPFVEGDRLYRTGDLARYLPDGNIEFLGRNDHQVKLRGFRIELGEIEARLLEYPGVSQALALVREDSPGDQRLVAYYLTTGSETVTAEALRAHLAHSLPDYMVPAAYVRLEALPLTPN